MTLAEALRWQQAAIADVRRQIDDVVIAAFPAVLDANLRVATLEGELLTRRHEENVRPRG